jgi:hypothetical protein
MTDQEDGTVVRPFADWLREQSKGATHDELSDALHRVVSAVRETGKKGRLMFVVTVAPMKDGVDVLLVTDEVTTSLPKPDRKPSLFYPDRSGNLSRTDPNQLEFESLREVASAARDRLPLKDAK